MTTVQLNLTIEQAHAVQRALDLYTRICLGQLEAIAHLVRDDTLPLHGADQRMGAPPGTCDEVDRALRATKAHLGFHPSGSFGISHAHVHLTGKRTYEIDKTLSRVLAVHRNPTPTFHSVDYDGLVVRYTTDPAPVVEMAVE